MGTAQVLDEDQFVNPPFAREQFEEILGGPRIGDYACPERALMRAVFQDAVLCLAGDVSAKSSSERKTLIAEARAWIEDTEHEGLFTFVSICELLGIEPERARAYLLCTAERRKTSRQRASTKPGPRRPQHSLHRLRDHGHAQAPVHARRGLGK